MAEKKPTGAQLYRRWLRGESMIQIWQDDRTGTLVNRIDVENVIRAYLVARDKRRKRRASNS